MQIIVISDTHRDFHALYEIVEKHRKEAALFIHLGDGERELEEIRMAFPDVRFESVRGNCDYASLEPAERIIEAGGRKLFICHGHTAGVKGSTSRLEAMARQRGCSIALYGHTHVADNRYLDGLYVMNPGSPSCPREGRPSYGVIDIVPAGIMQNIVRI